MVDVTLPACEHQNPLCGACGCETDHDGDSLYCDTCGLDYGDGNPQRPATYRDDSAQQCGVPCTNTWHGSRDLGPYDCRPCQLPAGHTLHHWTGCKPARRTSQKGEG